MSTKIVKSEIQRFLGGQDAEVLCVKGKWGVGKTYAWRQYLAEAENEAKLGLNKYAYVSLFGLNDLEALRYAIFESTVSTGQFLSGPDIGSLRAMLDQAGNLGRKARPLFAPLLNAIGISDAGEALSRAAFLSVRKQIVCLDDLERRGASLEIRDVLGLASMLKEQRHCKVILLLNDERLAKDDKDELQRQLEKVVDVSLVFEPSADEAVAIALSDTKPLSAKLKPKIVKLGITNIRVIKRIERLAERVVELLSGYREEVIDHGVHATVLGGWLVFQPDNAPTIDFLRQYNSLISAMRAKEGEKPENEREWEEVVERYGWSHTDELDLALFEGVAAGYFNTEKLTGAAKKIQAGYENSKEHSALSKAWKRYHQSLIIDDDEILDGLYDGAKESIQTVDPLNLNGTAKLLREFNRDDQADELIKLFVAQPNIDPNWLDDDLNAWGKERVDPALAAAFEKLKAEVVDLRNPRDVLIAMVTNQGWNEADIALLANQSAEHFEQLFESIEGENLRAVVKFAISLGGYDGENHKLVGAAVEGGLRRIGQKSPLRRRRIASFGIAFED